MPFPPSAHPWDAAKKQSIRHPRPSSLQGDEMHLDREYQLGLPVGMANRALAATREGAGENSHIKSAPS